MLIIHKIQDLVPDSFFVSFLSSEVELSFAGSSADDELLSLGWSVNLCQMLERKPSFLLDPAELDPVVLFEPKG